MKPKVPNTDVQDVKGMADGVTPMDVAVINRVVDAMVSKLTDHANIQALIDPPADLKPNAAANRAIQEATTALLEPIFAARRAKNLSFLSRTTVVWPEAHAALEESPRSARPGDDRPGAERKCRSAANLRRRRSKSRIRPCGSSSGHLKES